MLTIFSKPACRGFVRSCKCRITRKIPSSEFNASLQHVALTEIYERDILHAMLARWAWLHYRCAFSHIWDVHSTELGAFKVAFVAI